MTGKSYLLIAEDSRTIREQLAYLIKFPDLELLSAADGMQALQLFDQHQAQIKCVLTDIHMPQLEGLELARILRQDRVFKGPIAVLTQESDPQMVRQAKDIGINAWIVKPFRSDELLQTLQQLLQDPKFNDKAG